MGRRSVEGGVKTLVRRDRGSRRPIDHIHVYEDAVELSCIFILMLREAPKPTCTEKTTSNTILNRGKIYRVVSGDLHAMKNLDGAPYDRVALQGIVPVVSEKE